MPEVIDRQAKVYGSLLVLERMPQRNGRTYWLCECDCGKLTVVESHNLSSGNTRSCGCLRVKATSRSFSTHGMSKTPEYAIWCNMIQRCTNPNNTSWSDYGQRGISVCDRWKSFENFYADMGPRPEGLTLERIDVNGHYEPSNCSWADMRQQRMNQRRML